MVKVKVMKNLKSFAAPSVHEGIFWKVKRNTSCVGGVTWLYDWWVPASSKHGVPRSWVLSPSVLNEELEQISRYHTFSSVTVFAVASKEAVSVTSAFRGEQLGHGMLLFCTRLLWKLVAKLRPALWFKRSQICSLAIDLAVPLKGIGAGWVVTGWADSSYPLLWVFWDLTLRKTLMLYEWEVLLLALCFRWDDWESKKIVVVLEDPNISTWNRDHCLLLVPSSAVCLCFDISSLCSAR